MVTRTGILPKEQHRTHFCGAVLDAQESAVGFVPCWDYQKSQAINLAFFVLFPRRSREQSYIAFFSNS